MFVCVSQVITVMCHSVLPMSLTAGAQTCVSTSASCATGSQTVPTALTRGHTAEVCWVAAPRTHKHTTQTCTCTHTHTHTFNYSTKRFFLSHILNRRSWNSGYTLRMLKGWVCVVLCRCVDVFVCAYLCMCVRICANVCVCVCVHSCPPTPSSYPLPLRLRDHVEGSPY